jgi:hypothetical protein
MAGVGVVVPPPPPGVVTDPAPVKSRVNDASVPAALPVSAGNDPVAPAKDDVPPVIVADAVPEVEFPANRELTRAAGIVNVPVKVPPESVMVNGASTALPLSAAEVRSWSATVPPKVPFPMFVRFAVPDAESPVAPVVTVACTVSVVFVVAAGAVAHNSNASAVLVRVRVMVIVWKVSDLL